MMPDDFDLELELRRALCRVEPERDFSALSYSAWHRPSRLMALAAAIVLMVLLPVGAMEYRARQQRREQARADLIKALSITRDKLLKTRQMLVRQLDRRNAI